MELLKYISSKRRWAIEKARDVTKGYINGVQPWLNQFQQFRTQIILKLSLKSCVSRLKNVWELSKKNVFQGVKQSGTHCFIMKNNHRHIVWLDKTFRNIVFDSLKNLAMDGFIGQNAKMNIRLCQLLCSCCLSVVKQYSPLTLNKHTLYFFRSAHFQRFFIK